ncbi:MAG TPA: hypothetical protein VEV87_08240 [Chitinophagaceae bacterium]|nr:hypothetical protein [Chitinophagaceae bacterium]
MILTRTKEVNFMPGGSNNSASVAKHYYGKMRLFSLNSAEGSMA